MWLIEIDHFVQHSGLCRGGLTPAKKVTKSVKKKTVELSEARKSLRRQRNILSGRAESLTKLSKLSVYNDNGTDFANQYQQLPHNNNIYGTLRRNKKKSKSLNGDHLLETNKTTTTTTTTNESSQDSEQMVPNGTEIKTPKRSASVTGEALLGEILPVGEYHKQVERWLKDLLLPQYKELLINNGYDNLNFMVSGGMDFVLVLDICFEILGQQCDGRFESTGDRNNQRLSPGQDCENSKTSAATNVQIEQERIQ